MRIVALEEHVSMQSFQRALPFDPADRVTSPDNLKIRDDLNDVGPRRLKSMDENGISLQVLSVPGAGAAQLAGIENGPDYARRYNDAIASEARKHPDRFRTFAHLPMLKPDAAADELSRCVSEHGALGALISGTLRGKFLDDPMFEPVLARAEKLDVPIYVHPGVPPVAIRELYYDGFSPEVSQVFATSGLGWHFETAIHVVRLVLRGVFEKHPGLKIIVGHLGEALPFMLDRIEDRLSSRTGLKRGIAETIADHVYITTAGFFSFTPFMATLLAFGADKILFSVDYPFSRNEEAVRFLHSLPISPSEKEKIAHGNADRLLKLRVTE